jgi:hypothetical protein
MNLFDTLMWQSLQLLSLLPHPHKSHTNHPFCSSEIRFPYMSKYNTKHITGLRKMDSWRSEEEKTFKNIIFRKRFDFFPLYKQLLNYDIGEPLTSNSSIS